MALKFLTFLITEMKKWHPTELVASFYLFICFLEQAIPKCYFSCYVTALEVQDHAPWQREESTKEEPTEAIMKLLDIAANFPSCQGAEKVVTKQW